MVDIEVGLGSFTKVVGEIKDLVSDCVSRLRDDADDDLRYLVAERLPTLGSILLPDLLGILEDPDADSTAHYLAAWVALVVGDRDASVTVLRKEILRDTSWSLPAANALALRGVSASGTEIAVALDRASWNRDNPDIAQYSAALREVGGVMMPSTRERIVKNNDSWIARAVLADFPETD